MYKPIVAFLILSAASIAQTQVSHTANSPNISNVNGSVAKDALIEAQNQEITKLREYIAAANAQIAKLAGSLNGCIGGLPPVPQPIAPAVPAKEPAK